MISYETYKILHLIFILTFFSSLGFVASSSELVQNKIGKIILGIVSFLILAAGMGLIARVGFKHGEAFPLWLNLKIAAWLLVNILLICIFKIKKSKQKAAISLLLLLVGCGAVWLVLSKPV